MVDELYNFKDYYFENHPVENAINFYEDLKNEMDKTVMALQSHEGTVYFCKGTVILDRSF